MLVAGQSEFAARSLSVVCGTLSLPLFYQLLRRCGGRVSALAGCCILAVSAFHVYYSQEARIHALACFLCIAAAYTLIRACKLGGGWRWMAYALAAIACLYTFFYVTLILLALNLAVLFRRKMPDRGWWLANSLALAAWTPWLALAYSRLHPFIDNRLLPVPAPTPLELLELDSVGTEFGLTASRRPEVLPLALLILALALLAGWLLIRKASLGRYLLLGWAIVPTLAIDLLSLKLPVYQARYFLIGLPGWIAVAVLGLGAGLSGSRRRTVGVMAAAGAVLFSVETAFALHNNYADPSYARDDYRQAFAVMRASALPDEALIYDLPIQYTAVSYYGQGLGMPAIALPVPNPPDLLPEIALSPNNQDQRATQDQLNRLSGQYGGFWLLLYGDTGHWTEDWLDSHRLLVADRWFGVVQLKHYRPGPSPGAGTLAGGSPAGQDFGPLRLSAVRTAALQLGQRLGVDLLWTVTSVPAKDYAVSLQLFDPSNRRVAQLDGPPLQGGIGTSRWQAGQSYPDEVALPLPASLAPGIYRLTMAVYDAQLNPAGLPQDIALLPYLPNQIASAKPNAVSDAGWSLRSVEWAGDGSGGLIVVAKGTVQARPAKDYTWFAHLLDARGRLVGQDDHPPLVSTSSWQPGEQIQEIFRLPSTSQAVTLELGAYDSSGARVPYKTANGSADHLEIQLSGR